MDKCVYLKSLTSRCSKLNEIVSYKNCINCEYKEIKAKSKKKISKIAKMERNRSSVFTNDLDHCIICGKRKEHLHEIYEGRNRLNSMKYQFVIPLCSECHSQTHFNRSYSLIWKKRGQLYFERHFGDRNAFISIFGRSYL